MSDMPQLDFSTYPSQVFWLVVSFGATYLAVVFLLLPALKKSSMFRKGEINSIIEETMIILREQEDIAKRAQEFLNNKKKEISKLRDKNFKSAQLLLKIRLRKELLKLEKVLREKRKLLFIEKEELKVLIPEAIGDVVSHIYNKLLL